MSSPSVGAIATRMWNIVAQRPDSRLQGGDFGNFLLRQGYDGTIKDFLALFPDMFEHRFNNYVYLVQHAAHGAHHAYGHSPPAPASQASSDGRTPQDVATVEADPQQVAEMKKIIVGAMRSDPLRRLQGGIVGTMLRSHGYPGTVKDFLASTLDLFDHRHDNYVYLREAARAGVAAHHVTLRGPAHAVHQAQTHVHTSTHDVDTKALHELCFVLCEYPEGKGVLMSAIPPKLSLRTRNHILACGKLTAFVRSHSEYLQTWNEGMAGRDMCALTKQGRAYISSLKTPTTSVGASPGASAAASTPATHLNYLASNSSVSNTGISETATKSWAELARSRFVDTPSYSSADASATSASMATAIATSSVHTTHGATSISPPVLDSTVASVYQDSAVAHVSREYTTVHPAATNHVTAVTHVPPITRIRVPRPNSSDAAAVVTTIAGSSLGDSGNFSSGSLSMTGGVGAQNSAAQEGMASLPSTAQQSAHVRPERLSGQGEGETVPTLETAIPHVLVDSIDKLAPAFSRLTECTTVAVSCTCVGESDSAVLSLIVVLAVATKAHPSAVIYIFDALNPLVGRACVQLVWRIICRETVTKLCYDQRRLDIIGRVFMSYSAGQVDVECARGALGISDIQVLYGRVRLLCEGETTKRRAPLDEIMQHLGLPTNPHRDTMAERMSREADFMKRRPLDRDALAYAAWDVLPMPNAESILKSRITEAAVALATRGTVAVEEQRRSTYVTSGGQAVRYDEKYTISPGVTGSDFTYEPVEDDIDAQRPKVADVSANEESTHVTSEGRAMCKDVHDDVDMLLRLIPDDIRLKIVGTSDALGLGVTRLHEVRIDCGKDVSVLFNDLNATQCTLDGVTASVSDVIAALTLLHDGVAETDVTRTTGGGGIANRPLFGRDNRAGMEGTLHRITVIRNKHLHPVGLTLRVGRAAVGAARMISDVVAGVLPGKSGMSAPQSILLVGRRGVGKTTLLRDIARRLAEDSRAAQRVVIVDTTGDIGGHGDNAHPSIGKARRMHVPVALEHTIIEALENHNPRVLVIDDIATSAHTGALRTCVRQGVAFVGAVHEESLFSMAENSELIALVSESALAGDGTETAARPENGEIAYMVSPRRKSTPLCSRVVEIPERNRVIISWGVARGMNTLPGESSGNASFAVVREERWLDDACGVWKAKFTRVLSGNAGTQSARAVDAAGTSIAEPSWVRALLDKTNRLQSGRP